MRRFKPMARGRAAQFRRTLSIITLELAEGTGATKKSGKSIKIDAVALAKVAKPRSAKKPTK